MTLPYQEVFSSGNRQFRIEANNTSDSVQIHVFEIIEGISLRVLQIGGQVTQTENGKFPYDGDEALELQIEKVKSDILLLTSAASIGL